MNVQNLVRYLKNDGIKVVVFYFIFSLFNSILGILVSGSNISINPGSSLSGNPFSMKLLIAGIVSILIALIANAGAIGSFNELLSNEKITFKSFIKNGRKYFLETLGFSFAYYIFVGIIVLIPCVVLLKFIGSSNNSIVTIIAGIGINVFAVPYIVLNVLDKSVKGYIKKNFKLLLAYGIVVALIPYIPFVGTYIAIIINCIYILAIIMLHEDFINESINTTIS